MARPSVNIRSYLTVCSGAGGPWGEGRRKGKRRVEVVRPAASCEKYGTVGRGNTPGRVHLAVWFCVFHPSRTTENETAGM